MRFNAPLFLRKCIASSLDLMGHWPNNTIFQILSLYRYKNQGELWSKLWSKALLYRILVTLKHYQCHIRLNLAILTRWICFELNMLYTYNRIKYAIYLQSDGKINSVRGPLLKVLMISFHKPHPYCFKAPFVSLTSSSVRYKKCRLPILNRNADKEWSNFL